MKLVDLKRPKPPKDKNSKADQPCTVDPSYEERPYCLRFTLENHELEKLGVTPQSFGGMEPIMATIEIEPISIRHIESKNPDNYDKEHNKSVEFQIMKIGFEDMKVKAPSKVASWNKLQNGRPE
jgi:hypothetical protein